MRVLPYPLSGGHVVGTQLFEDQAETEAPAFTLSSGGMFTSFPKWGRLVTSGLAGGFRSWHGMYFASGCANCENPLG